MNSEQTQQKFVNKESNSGYKRQFNGKRTYEQESKDEWETRVEEITWDVKVHDLVRDMELDGLITVLSE